MDVNVELIIVGKLLIALVLGAFIGFDRERHGRDAGNGISNGNNV
ncbi:MAG TPA: MgtC/SapB family protein [Chitinophaga sp.]|nr:MgtC/SapB family protein [Chitinophaga sp.]HVI45180.1 MgtC/SapB family protein [Chitinophaga sp.]